MNWYKKSYDSNMAMLRDHLRHGFDPYDYEYELQGFLDSNGIDFDPLPDEEVYETATRWIEQASPKDVEDFKEYVLGMNPNSFIESDEPAYQHLDFKSVIKPGWLVHFTNDAESIRNRGFMYGHDEFRGLGLTTHKTEERRRDHPGFNFAFEIDTRDLSNAARSGKYGKEAVVFWGGGVKAFHYGDEENQIIFWGPSVNRSMIFPIRREYDNWVVEAENGRTMVESEDFNDVVGWVVQNWRMLQQISDKNNRKR